MNAKTRYRQRLKVQATLVRLMEVLADNGAEAIPPDPTTALMAWQAVRKLLPFIKASGLDAAALAAPDGSGSDLARFGRLKQARQKATHSRRRRNEKTLGTS